MRRSIVYFGQATAKDPGFAGAYAALASSYNVAAGWGFLRPAEAYSNAETAVRKALALDNTLADAHSAYAENLHEYHWGWAGAEREYQEALELNPSSAAGHKLYAEYLTHAGRYTEALGENRKAQELDPASLITNAFVCFVYYHAREYDKAIRECSKTVALDSSFVPAHYWRGASYVFAGRYEEALGDFRKASELSEGATYFQTWTALAYAVEGKKDQARKILEQLRRHPRDVYVSAYGLADIYISLGDREQAISMLDKACQERSADLVFLATAQEFDVLHGDPEFQQMIARLDFPNSAIADAKASKPSTLNFGWIGNLLVADGVLMWGWRRYLLYRLLKGELRLLKLRCSCWTLYSAQRMTHGILHILIVTPAVTHRLREITKALHCPGSLHKLHPELLASIQRCRW